MNTHPGPTGWQVRGEEGETGLRGRGRPLVTPFTRTGRPILQDPLVVESSGPSPLPTPRTRAPYPPSPPICGPHLKLVHSKETRRVQVQTPGFSKVTPVPRPLPPDHPQSLPSAASRGLQGLRPDPTGAMSDSDASVTGVDESPSHGPV